MPSSRSGGPLPYLDHLAADSARFRAVLATAPEDARVPSCPDWDADDLLWHLGEVQWFWGEIAERGLTDPDQLEAMEAAREERPADRPGLLAFFDRSSARLHRQLTDLAPTTPLWMWADDKTAGYIARRQAHEALVHRLDAELTVGDRTPLDPRLAADGIDEVLRIMRGHEPDEELSHAPVSGPVTIATVDAMHAWTVTPVRITGSWNGREIDLQRFLVADGPDPSSVAEISGTAADLDCWLWNRPPEGPIARDGDPTALVAVDAVLSDSID